MAVENKTLTAEQKAVDGSQREVAEAKVKESILDSLDLSAEVEINRTKGGEPNEAPKKEEKTEEAEEETTEESEETTEEESSEDTEEETSEEGEAEEEEEGEEAHEGKKSNYQKRIDRLTAEKKALAEENARLKAAKEVPEADDTDPDVKKLNNMSDAELKATRKAVAIAIKKETDDGKLDKLLDLQDKVDTALQTAPHRFVQRQVSKFNEVADQIAAKKEIKMTPESAKALKEIAAQIYGDNPAFHKMVDGQAIALKLAYDHYKTLNSKSAEKGKAEELRRENTTLKRKTALDSSGVKKTVAKDAIVKTAREKAGRGSDTNDKLNLIKVDPVFGLDGLIPDEYKEE